MPHQQLRTYIHEYVDTNIVHCRCTSYLVPDWSSESSDDGSVLIVVGVEGVLIVVGVGMVEVVAVVVSITASLVVEDGGKPFIATYIK